MGVLWPAPFCSCPLPSPNWEQTFPVSHGSTCMKQDPKASAQLPRRVQPQAAHLNPQPWHGVAWGSNAHLGICVSLQVCSTDRWGQT